MKIHYYYKHEYGNFGFYKLELRAYLEEKEYSKSGDLRYSYRCIEQLNLHLSRNQKEFQCNNFKHYYGAQCALFHHSHSTLELDREMECLDMKRIDRRYYEKFRKVGLALYQSIGLVDFSNFAGPQQSIGQVIIDD